MVLFLNGGPEGSQDPPRTSRKRFSERFGTLLGWFLTSRGGFAKVLAPFWACFRCFSSHARCPPARTVLKKIAMVPPPRNLFFGPFNCIAATSHDDVLRTARYRRGSRAPGGEEGARAAIEGLDVGALGSQLRYQVESRLA